MGTVSATGRRAISMTSPSGVQTSTDLANRDAGTDRGNGGSIRSTSRWRPSGAAATRANSPGRPMSVRRPVASATVPIWLVKW